MKGIDTNVLVRYLVWDDRRQAVKAANYIAGVVKAGEKCFINLVVFCEMIWVLESAYKYRRDEITRVCDMILMTKQFEIERRDIVKGALNEYRNGRADFADYLIGRINHECGCDITFTFDRLVKNTPFFQCL